MTQNWTTREAGTEATPDGVGLLNKAFLILDQFTAEHPSWTQAELWRKTDISRSTVNRLVRYFCARDYLVPLETRGRYGLGPAAVELGLRASAHLALDSVGMAFINELAERTRETSLLAAYRPGRREVVCIAQIPSPHEGLQVFRNIGSAIPLHAGAVAKAVLAFLPESVLSSILAAPLERIAENTITDPEALAGDIAEIRRRGYATSYEETYPGAYGIGAPVTGPGDVIVGSVAIAGPLLRMDRPTLLKNARNVVSVAEALSRRLCGHGSSR